MCPAAEMRGSNKANSEPIWFSFVGNSLNDKVEFPARDQHKRDVSKEKKNERNKVTRSVVFIQHNSSWLLH